jgi:hypothetical protein
MPTQQEIDDFKQDVTDSVDKQTKRASIKRSKIGGFYRTIADWFSDLIDDNEISPVKTWSSEKISEEISSIESVVTTYGEIILGADRLVVDWEVDKPVGELLTFFEKHGDLKNVIIQTERPFPLEAGFFQQSFDSYKSLDYSSLILDNGGDHMRWLIFSKKNQTTPIPPDELVIYAGGDKIIYQSESGLLINNASITVPPGASITFIDWAYEYSEPSGLPLEIVNHTTLLPFLRNPAGQLEIGVYYVGLTAGDSNGGQKYDQMTLTVIPDPIGGFNFEANTEWNGNFEWI